MDYRKRKYYLVSLPCFDHDYRLEHMTLVAPSLKMHAPYNHICFGTYDGKFYQQTNVMCPEMMISCKLEEADALEYELRKMSRDIAVQGRFCELTKEMCKQ